MLAVQFRKAFILKADSTNKLIAFLFDLSSLNPIELLYISAHIFSQLFPFDLNVLSTLTFAMTAIFDKFQQNNGKAGKNNNANNSNSIEYDKIDDARRWKFNAFFALNQRIIVRGRVSSRFNIRTATIKTLLPCCLVVIRCGSAVQKGYISLGRVVIELAAVAIDFHTLGGILGIRQRS